jgi:hypothetical protein
MIEHFPVSKGARSDPQLIWNFGESEVEVKSFESSLDSKGQYHFFSWVNLYSAAVFRSE